MATCRDCSTKLPGRRRVCDDCKAKNRRDRSSNTTEAASPAPVVIPDGLHRRGRELWTSLEVEADTPAGALALEACRAADRLEELDRIVAGKGVLQLMKFRLEPDWWDDNGDQHVHVKVSFQAVLTEARLQQATFKDLLKELDRLRKQAAAAPAAGQPPAPTPVQPPATGLDEFTKRRTERRGEKTS